MRILLVDDEPLILKAYGRFLSRKCGHDVVTANGGADACAELESDTVFDVIFCDLSMPNTDGVQVHRTVCEFHPELARRFVFLTGGITSESESAYLASIDARILDKPVRETEFEKAIADYGGGGAEAE
jgi:CheY-like chemotaxis protein